VNLAAYAARASDSETWAMISRYGSHIRDLQLCNCTKLTSPFLKSLPLMLKRLEKLHLCQLRSVDDSVVLNVIKSCSRLTSLSFFGCQNITDLGLKELYTLKYLEQFSLGNCPRITDQSIMKLGSSLLKDLTLRGCHRLTSSSIKEVVRRSPSLEKLNLQGLAITDSLLVDITQYCLQLTSLNIASANPFGGNAITDVSALSLVRLPQLRSLNLQGSSRLTDTSLIHIARHCVLLERINLGGCSKLTDLSLKAFAKYTPNLTHISLFQCYNIKNEGFEALYSLSKLHQLDVHSCNQLTDDCLLPLITNNFPIPLPDLSERKNKVEDSQKEKDSISSSLKPSISEDPPDVKDASTSSQTKAKDSESKTISEGKGDEIKTAANQVPDQINLPVGLLERKFRADGSEILPPGTPPVGSPTQEPEDEKFFKFQSSDFLSSPLLLPSLESLNVGACPAITTARLDQLKLARPTITIHS
jgi:hypothetical protein